MKILIADDDRELNCYIETWLTAMGCEVVTALDAMQTMYFSVKDKPDVILLDVEMPGGTGRKALLYLKKSDETRSIPVVAFSGSSNPFLYYEMTDLGAEDFLQKPVEPDVLYGVLRHFAERGKREQL
jgi:CheY-like chemotaxis protein